ncbi:transposase, partial [Ligilactobacillus agilis]
IVEIVYKTNQTIQYKPDNGRYLGIDPGVNNAFTLATNVSGITPVIVNGKPIKAINQLYNKQRAQLTRIHDLLGQNRSSHRLASLDFYRNQKMNSFAHEASKRIVDFALSHGL